MPLTLPSRAKEGTYSLLKTLMFTISKQIALCDGEAKSDKSAVSTGTSAEKTEGGLLLLLIGGESQITPVENRYKSVDAIQVKVLIKLSLNT
jgi:hypothetical protein